MEDEGRCGSDSHAFAEHKEQAHEGLQTQKLKHEASEEQVAAVDGDRGLREHVAACVERQHGTRRRKMNRDLTSKLHRGEDNLRGQAAARQQSPRIRRKQASVDSQDLVEQPDRKDHAVPRYILSQRLSEARKESVVGRQEHGRPVDMGVVSRRETDE